MPATSLAQRRFFGMVHNAQKGNAPMASLHGPAREAAKSMTTSQTSDFACTKEKGLPERIKRSSLDFLLLSAILQKQADFDAALSKAEKALSSIHTSRHKSLQAYTKKLIQENAKLKQEKMKSEIKALEDSQKMQSKQQLDQQQQLQAQQANLPAAQPPYGAMALQQSQQQEGASGAQPAAPAMSAMK